MKSTEFINESNLEVEGKTIASFLADVSNWWNKSATNDAQIYTKEIGAKVWTRGDGVRCRDPARILACGNNTNILDSVWDALTKLKGATVVGNVSQEFPSMGDGLAMQFKGLILVKRDRCIDVMSKSRVANPNSVWKQRK